MGSIEENGYRYSIDTLAKVSIVPILWYPSENPHHKFHIHNLVTYFDIFQLSDFKFFWFLRNLPCFYPSLVISISDFLFCIFGHYSSNNTKYQYLNKVSILNDTKSYRYYFAPLVEMCEKTFLSEAKMKFSIEQKVFIFRLYYSKKLYKKCRKNFQQNIVRFY